MNLKKLIKVKDSQGYSYNWSAINKDNISDSIDCVLDVLEWWYGNTDAEEVFINAYNKYIKANSDDKKSDPSSTIFYKANLKGLSAVLPNADEFAKMIFDYPRYDRNADLLDNFLVNKNVPQQRDPLDEYLRVHNDYGWGD